MKFFRRRSRILLATFAVLWTASAAIAQDSKSEPIAERVRLLLRQMDADQREDRDKATEAILKLGPEILTLLPPLDDQSLSAEQRQRLRKVLPRLWQVRLDSDIAGRSVDLGAAAIPLTQAVQKLAATSGNRIVDMREQFNQELTNPTVAVGKATFWQALDAVAEQSKLSCYFATEDRSIGLVGRPKKSGPVCYAGAFRFELQRLGLEMPFDDPAGGPHSLFKVEMMFEPRLRPTMIEIDTETIAAVDNKDRPVAYAGQKEISFPVERDSYVVPLTLKLAAPVRDAVSLKKFSGQVSMSLPIHVQRFVFDQLASDKPVEKSSPGVKVWLNKLGVQDGTWTASMSFETLADAGSRESHFKSALEMEVYLESVADGKRFKQNGGMNTVAAEATKTSVEYLFVDAPGKPADYRLIVNAPTGVGRVPVKFHFENISLP